MSRLGFKLSPGGPLCRAMGIKTVFVNIDWKRSRHQNAKSAQRNLKLLADTIESIVSRMQPAVLCMCEVGEAATTLDGDHLQQVATTAMKAWEGVATKHVSLKALYDLNAPYMTIYNEQEAVCTQHRILRKLFTAHGHPRTAQAFLCRGVGARGIAVGIINVHAPSGKTKLTDTQRATLLRSLLQTNSTAMPGRPLGRGRFIVGGDMNTGSHALGQMLEALHQDNLLGSPAGVMEPVMPRHGDACVLCGVVAKTLDETAVNHDKQHVPYGVEWETTASEEKSDVTTPKGLRPDSWSPRPILRRHAESYVTTPLAQTAASRLASSLATEQTRPGNEASSPEKELAAPTIGFGSLQCAHEVLDWEDVTEQQPLPEDKGIAQTAASRLPPSLATEQTGLGNEAASPEKELAAPTIRFGSLQCEDEVPDRGDVTKQQPLPEDKLLAYSIVNEFLGKVTYENPKAEGILLKVLDDASSWSEEQQSRIKEVFDPIFFHFPLGLGDRTVWNPREAAKYIRYWGWLATKRDEVQAGANSRGAVFAKEQIQQVWAICFEKFKTTLRPDQREKKWTYYKSCFESALRKEAGSTFVVNAIWEVGLPPLPAFATEPRRVLSLLELEAVPRAIHDILVWLDSIAATLIKHRSTPEYAIAKRKSGHTHGVSGLDATEQQMMHTIRTIKRDIQQAATLAKQWDRKELTHEQCQSWQWRLLTAHWDGSLRARLEAATAEYPADLCRKPTVALSSSSSMLAR